MSYNNISAEYIYWVINKIENDQIRGEKYAQIFKLRLLYERNEIERERNKIERDKIELLKIILIKNLSMPDDIKEIITKFYV